MVSSGASTPKQSFRCYPVTGHVGDLAEHARMDSERAFEPVLGVRQLGIF